MQQFGSLIWLAFLFGLLWFMMIRPQRERERRRREMLERLRTGDRVVTIGGFHGHVVAVGEDTIRLRIADGVEVDFQKSGIAAIRDGPGRAGGDTPAAD